MPSVKRECGLLGMGECFDSFGAAWPLSVHFYQQRAFVFVLTALLIILCTACNTSTDDSCAGCMSPNAKIV